MVSLKNVNRDSNFQTATSPSVGSNPIRTASVAPSSSQGKRDEDLDSSIRSKANLSTDSSDKTVKAATIERKEDTFSGSMESKDHHRRPSTTSSPMPSLSENLPTHSSSSPASESSRRRSLSSSNKVDRGLSDDLSEMKTPAGVWTDVSSVSSESEMEGPRPMLSTEVADPIDHPGDEHDSSAMQWNTWLAERYEKELQGLPHLRPMTVQSTLTTDIPSAEGILNESSQSDPSNDQDTSHHGNHQQIHIETNDEIGHTSIFLCDGNSIPFTSSDVDEYTLLLLSQLIIRAQRWCQKYLQWTENYYSHFLQTSQHFSGIPTCVVVYRLERILLYEMLKDNTGEGATPVPPLSSSDLVSLSPQEDCYKMLGMISVPPSRALTMMMTMVMTLSQTQVYITQQLGQPQRVNKSMQWSIHCSPWRYNGRRRA
jgi:hypothetical protein